MTLPPPERKHSAGLMSAVPQHPAAPMYRADIDGLRALAVIAVLLFHAGIAGFQGGYVGVDVFFVVSGYLITQLLMTAQAGPARLSLGVFYERRARRILPALLFTCAVTAVAGWWLLLPAELSYLGRDLAAASVLLSNLAAWSAGGYFAATLAAPLHHLWSIAVEEQFYLLYPLVLLGVSRYLPQRRRATLSVLALVSLGLCVWASHHRPNMNYFAAPTRAWELLLGAVLALSPAARLPRVARECLAAAGLLALAFAVCCYNPARISYPGAFTLAPCLATAALISTGGTERAVVNRLLAWRPLVFVGLVSYSLYLWHQPLLIFAADYHITPLSVPARLGVLGCAFVLALLSWRFIEQPVRRRTLFRTTRALLVAAVLASAAVTAVGLVLWNSQGFPQRFSPAARALLGNPDQAMSRVISECLSRPTAQIAAGNLCEFGDRSAASPRALLWGDSHALAVLPAYGEIAAQRHLHLYFIAKSACWPLLHVADRTRTPEQNAACASFNEAVVAAIGRLKPATIILGGFWSDDQLQAAPDLQLAGDESAFTAAMRRTLTAVNDDGKRAVCVVLDAPTLKYPGSYALVMAQLRHIPDDFLRLSHVQAVAPVRDMERDTRALAQAGALQFADPKKLLCPADSCLYKAQGQSLYFDADHLSAAGAHYVAPELESCLTPRSR
jgi:peptidoglycan/LPS O-acetylase OafA/YrhL